MNKELYEFGDFTLDVRQKNLRRDGQAIPLQPKVFDMLVFFAENSGELVSRDDLMRAVWAGTFVEETNLRFCIHSLRKALGKTADGKDYVETIPKRGYRFVAEVSKKSAAPVAEKVAEEIAPIQEEISESKNSLEIPPQVVVEKNHFAKRRWLIGAVAVAAIGCLILAFTIGKKRAPVATANALSFSRLAVLPFETIGERERVMQIGLTDSMISNLGKIKNLDVLSIASVRRYAGQNFDAAAAGRELSADAVLSGSFRFDGEKIQVIANLRRTADGAAIWSETFTVQGKTDFERETAIALRAARLLSLKIADAEDEQSIANENLNPEAVQHYLAARRIYRTGELFRRKEMNGLFEKCVQLEPYWALARAAYAEALLTSDQLLVEWEKAEQTANKTIEFNKNLAQPHAVLGEIYQWRDWNWEKSEAEFKRAVALNPNYAAAYHKYSQFLRVQRRFAEAEATLEKAVELEPFSPIFHASFCELYVFDRKFEKALEACNRAKQIEPDYWRVPKLLYWIYVERKMYPELGEMILGKLSPAERETHPLTKALAENDLRSFWQSLIDEPSRSGKARPVSLAMFYLKLGEREKTLDQLELALAQRDMYFPAVNADLSFDSIRDEKRFAEMMKKIGLQK